MAEMQHHLLKYNKVVLFCRHGRTALPTTWSVLQKYPVRLKITILFCLKEILFKVLLELCQFSCISLEHLVYYWIFEFFYFLNDKFFHFLNAKVVFYSYCPLYCNMKLVSDIAKTTRYQYYVHLKI